MDDRDLRILNPMHLDCQECRVASEEDAMGWRLYLAPDPDDRNADPMLAAYCPECATREFGAVQRARRAHVDG